MPNAIARLLAAYRNRLPLRRQYVRASEIRAALDSIRSELHDDSIRAHEAAKRQWIAANPAATPEQYEKAMRLLAKRYGI